MPQKKRISLKNTTRIGRGLENQSFASDKFMPFFLSLTAMVITPTTDKKTHNGFTFLGLN
ncbi:hypothetical protein DVG78_23690 [Runella aurantiaca]|uniref:Uncharacterized protein n=1 Tax=Runella aurantiaca TaxID=2282308 RepID=A0A369IA18_9BACT|nr:hypothetical protein DVG78_23690 [Runella aurantiaca]